MSALRTRCRRLKRTKGLALVVVDYLQLMRPAAGTQAGEPGAGNQHDHPGPEGAGQGAGGPGHRAVAAFRARSRTARTSGRNFPICVKSGSIEQDADAVMFVYRDEYYLEQKMPKEVGFEGSADKFHAAMEEWQQRMDKAHNRADLIIAKQRHGPTGTIPLLFEGEFTRFGDLDLHPTMRVARTTLTHIVGASATLALPDIACDDRALAARIARHALARPAPPSTSTWRHAADWPALRATGRTRHGSRRSAGSAAAAPARRRLPAFLRRLAGRGAGIRPRCVPGAMLAVLSGLSRAPRPPMSRTT